MKKAVTDSHRLERVGASARDMQRRLMEHITNKTTDRGAGPMFNDAGAYNDPKWFEAEKHELFRKLPLMVGLSRDIPRPGDKLLFDAVGPSILIVRANDHRIRGFLNMCPHRAAKVVVTCRSSQMMTCPFHGWTFDLEGKLVGLPGRESFIGINQSELRLISVPVVEWHGMIFAIASAGDQPIDIEAYLGSLAQDLAMHDLGNCKPVKKSRYDANANWKYTIDTFGEAYHVATLHPKTVGKIVVQDTVVYDDMSPHHRIGFALKEWSKVVEPSTGSQESPYGMALLLFPNTIVQIQGPSARPTYIFYHIFPGDNVNSSFTMVGTYRSGEIPEEEGLAFYEAEHDAQQHIVEREDYVVAGTAQANLKYAPEGFRVVYGSNEIALQRFQRRVAELIGRELIEQ